MAPISSNPFLNILCCWLINLFKSILNQIIFSACCNTFPMLPNLLWMIWTSFLCGGKDSYRILKPSHLWYSPPSPHDAVKVLFFFFKYEQEFPILLCLQIFCFHCLLWSLCPDSSWKTKLQGIVYWYTGDTQGSLDIKSVHRQESLHWVLEPIQFRCIFFVFVCLFYFVTIFKAYVEFVTILFPFYVCFFGQEACEILPPTRDQTHIPCIGRWNSNHWTIRKSLWFSFIHDETEVQGEETIIQSHKINQQQTKVICL